MHFKDNTEFTNVKAMFINQGKMLILNCSRILCWKIAQHTAYEIQVIYEVLIQLVLQQIRQALGIFVMSLLAWQSSINSDILICYNQIFPHSEVFANEIIVIYMLPLILNIQRQIQIHEQSAVNLYCPVQNQTVLPRPLNILQSELMKYLLHYILTFHPIHCQSLKTTFFLTIKT